MSRSLRVKLRHWHRNVGAAIALAAVFIVVTGLVINHSPQLQLDQAGVSPEWILDHYGIDVAPPDHGWQLKSRWISHCGAQIYLDDRPLFRSPGLLAAASIDQLILTASAEQLSLISPEGEIIEQLGREALPGLITGLTSRGNEVFLSTPQGWFQTDINFLGWQRIPEAPVSATAPAALPPTLATTIHRQARALELTWERVLLDLHSGRFFGRWGPWVIDAIALGIALLALSGFWLWFRAQSRHH